MKKYFNQIALMKPKYLDKWTGTVTFQKMLEALKMTSMKKNFLQAYNPGYCATEDTGYCLFF